MSRTPPLIVCPYCQPGPIGYAGTVLSIVCAACRAQIKEALEDKPKWGKP